MLALSPPTYGHGNKPPDIQRKHPDDDHVSTKSAVVRDQIWPYIAALTLIEHSALPSIS